MTFPDHIRTFLQEEKWTFAKTMQEWPHEYLVRERVDAVLFEAMVNHIREHGFEGRFYSKPITYFAEGGIIYWTMGAPIPDTIIINRCKEEESYENRLKNGTLPKETIPNKNKQNKTVDSTATRITSPASSLRSGQEPRHGQP